MENATKAMLIIPDEEWQWIKEHIRELTQKLTDLQLSLNTPPDRKVSSPYITAKEFMAAVRICRSNFDKLVGGQKIMTIKKGRKIYVVASEVKRYFKEVEV